MIVNNTKILVKAQKKHSDLRKPLNSWLKIVRSEDFKGFDDLQKVFPKADRIKNSNFVSLTVFDIKGNSYRLIVDIDYY